MIEPAGSFPANGMVVATDGGAVVAVATPAGVVHPCNCSLGTILKPAATPTCTFSDLAASTAMAVDPGQLLSVAASSVDSTTTVWVGATSGLYMAALKPFDQESGGVAITVTDVISTSAGINAVVWSPPSQQPQQQQQSTAVAGGGGGTAKRVEHGFIAAGNSEKLWIVDPVDGSIVRWEWVTDVATASGGVVDVRLLISHFI